MRSILDLISSGSRGILDHSSESLVTSGEDVGWVLRAITNVRVDLLGLLAVETRDFLVGVDGHENLTHVRLGEDNHVMIVIMMIGLVLRDEGEQGYDE